MNPTKRFLNLLPSSPLIIVTVSNIHGDDTSTVTLFGGGSFIVQGTSVAIGQKAYVQNERIQGIAPSLPLFEITV